MKKLLRVIRLILVAAFITVSVFLTINTLRIRESQAVVERVLKEDVTYFNEGFSINNFLDRDYDKFKDTKGVEYWIDVNTEKFMYLYNLNIDAKAKAIDEADAKQLAYDEAKKWDPTFFESDSMIERINDEEYEFYMFQLDAKGYKTGKFIIIKIVGDDVEYLSMHTYKNYARPSDGSIMSESNALDIAYDSTAESEFSLKRGDDHLYSTRLYENDSMWVWDIKIWRITSEDIELKTQPILTGNFYNCRVDANTGEILISEWVQDETTYCPLDGTIS